MFCAPTGRPVDPITESGCGRPRLVRGGSARRAGGLLRLLLALLAVVGLPARPAQALDGASPAVRMARIDATIETIKSQPLIGAIIRDEAEAETALRLALAMDRPPYYIRSQDVLRALRKDYAIPALKAADDEVLLIVWARTSDLVGHLAATDPSLCKDVAFGAVTSRGVQDPRTRHLYEAMMRASEAAYHNGKGRPPRPGPSPDDLAAMADRLAISPAVLADLAAAGPAEACAVSRTLLDGLSALPMPTRAVIMRWFLTL
ncbi:hypothetical protein [Phreatobacter stygius]|uniref:Uncharacterized protein n=1 Tax=Phreatobacter stygius TaxID=1940610 RepID=A0A4D7B3X5_9HYPH|nr:hypothetical protein [Phreatobacter stygius]QCI67601.1 hypothetical protein E8M01_27265 [Phreatobacter stygius]